MQDLYTIHKLNAEAVERSIPSQLASGRTVVAEYSGLHFVGYETFSGETAREDALAKAAELNARNDGTTAKIFTPEEAAA